MHEAHQASGLGGNLLLLYEPLFLLWLLDKHHSFLSGPLDSEAQRGRQSCCFLPPS